ncbi:hypothetical protein [Clostridium minihomine]|uniref:hypothetical protein n=1 Tax=Clostridium minihomine TaxID=2045012 RepID=UPI000C75929C|nr:hypothetical protein [Clostridium minihomine]
MEDSAIFLIIGVVVSIISVVAVKRLAQTVYNQTGYNGLSGINKLLMLTLYILPLGVTMMQSGGGLVRNDAQTNGTMLILFLVPLAILIIRNLKAKNPAYIVGLTLLQVLCGLILFFVIVFKFVFRSNGKNFSIDTNTINQMHQSQADQRHREEMEAQEEAAKKDKATAQADAYARGWGYRDSEEAEREGIHTGHPNK